MQTPNHLASIAGRIELVAKGNATAELLIYGDIGESWGRQYVEAATVVAQLDKTAAEIIKVRINSYGGSVIDGLAIYNALKRHPARVEVTIDGLAASIASLIAMAGDTVEMPANALLMIHAPMGGVMGNLRDIEQYTPALRAMETAMASSYAAKTGRPVAEMLALLQRYEDLYYSAAEAKAAGFCDAITEDELATARAAKAQAILVSQPDFQRVQAGMPARFAAALNALPPLPTDREHAMSNAQAATITAAQQQEIIAAERERVRTITAMADGDPRLQAVSRQSILDGDSFEIYGKKALAALAYGREPLAGTGWPVGTTGPASASGRPGGDDFVAAASDALAMRAGISVSSPHASARDLRNMPIVEIARACLSRRDREAGLGGPAAIRAAMTTSDFPMILGDTMAKALRAGYDLEPGTQDAWVRHSFVPDFKLQSRVILGAMPDLQFVAEGAEYTYDSMTEDRSLPFSILKYGVIVKITWEMLVNDDLNAFGRIPQGLGQAARRKEADLVYGLFNGSGPAMQDGLALFHATHANLATSSTGLTEEALAKGRLMLRKQSSVGGGALNLTPRFLLVPAELEGDAEKILAASAIHVSAGLENATPDWIRRLQLVVESRLPAGAAYLAANPAQIDTVEVAHLDEERGPVVKESEGFRDDTIEYKVRDSFAARALDWRGLVKLPIA